MDDGGGSNSKVEDGGQGCWGTEGSRVTEGGQTFKIKNHPLHEIVNCLLKAVLVNRILQD